MAMLHHYAGPVTLPAEAQCPSEPLSPAERRAMERLQRAWTIEAVNRKRLREKRCVR